MAVNTTPKLKNSKPYETILTRLSPHSRRFLF